MAEQLKSAKSCCSSSCKVGVHIQTSHPVLGSFCTVKTFYIFKAGHLVVVYYLDTAHCSEQFLQLLWRQAPCIELSWPPPVISRRHLAVTSGSSIRRLFGPLPPFPPCCFAAAAQKSPQNIPFLSQDLERILPNFGSQPVSSIVSCVVLGEPFSWRTLKMSNLGNTFILHFLVGHPVVGNPPYFPFVSTTSSLFMVLLLTPC